MTHRRIFVDGVFDLFHYGHMQLFYKIKQLFPNSYLIAGINSYNDIEKYKCISILTSEEKAKTIKHCKYIDEIIVDTPWVLDQDFINKHNIDYVCHDPTPYLSNDIDDTYYFCKQKGIFIGINRTPNISTSEIIRRVKNLR